MIGGINGDDAIEPGAPPICFGICAAACAHDAAAGTCIFVAADPDPDPAPPRLRKLRFFFDIYHTIT